ncbi:hypothetical protein [Streptomyces ipomoeae]|uniref:hypothetical protein n=1 Tax=Streptomyces ipomoeae TaxID=103232 RepID=UPI001147921C|nr:hypothetical protein [Streptomyces ipomoeae]MDX2935532.1 hypothetical protein [Streptomyces ipomoeae]TQE18359.1 hypothetical protein SipoB123_33875 [Streptomyces ipomoeae]
MVCEGRLERTVPFLYGATCRRDLAQDEGGVTRRYGVERCVLTGATVKQVLLSIGEPSRMDAAGTVNAAPAVQ